MEEGSRKEGRKKKEEERSRGKKEWRMGSN